MIEITLKVVKLFVRRKSRSPEAHISLTPGRLRLSASNGAREELRLSSKVFGEPKSTKCYVSFEIEDKRTILQISERKVCLINVCRS